MMNTVSATYSVSSNDRPLDIIQRFWGYDSFLPLQEEAMQSVLEERDSIVVLPTGGGKSLCYQVPALCMDGMAVVVSPLISLMKDQVDALQACGIQAACVNSTMDAGERRQVADDIRAGELKILYLAPERLLTERMLEFLTSTKLSFIAIDEAHCISEWGHDFRPEYREMNKLREIFPGITLHAYTATATEQVREDIARQLGVSEPEVLVGSFDRPNLIYKVERRNNRMEQICSVLDRHKGETGIIYAIRRADVDDICKDLKRNGYKALPYHAGKSNDQRKRNQDAFIQEKVDTIVATVAFGMGIDKSNVRYVIHAGMPKSLENYQQESGRGGRDGLEAECCLFYSGGDFSLWKRMLSDLDGKAYEAAMESLTAMNEFCTGMMCRHRAIVSYFGQELEKETCGACDVCLDDLDLVDEPLVIAQKILSCIVRLKQGFGGDYVSKVLIGSKEKRILEQGHNQLSTHGILSDHDRLDLRDWIDQLVGQKFLVKAGDYSVLEVTPAGREVLSGEREPRLLKPKRLSKSKSRKKIPLESWEGVDRGLFDLLRDLRRIKAEEAGKPAYIVFGDEALRDMARRRPSTPEAFLDVKGVGEKKRNDYGAEFIACMTEYCREQSIAMDVGEQTQSVVQRKVNRVSRPNDSTVRAFELFAEGKTVEEVAAIMDRAQSTSFGYLDEYIRTKSIEDATPWIDAEIAQKVESAAGEIGFDRLKPIFECFDGKISYDEIRVVVWCLRNRVGEV